MMNTTKIFFFLSLLGILAVLPAQARKSPVRQQDAYMIGIAMALTDSSVFLTDMQQVKGVTISRKHKFLMDRQMYSIQLERFLLDKYKGGPYVATVYFGFNTKKMTRKYLALHKLHSAKNKLSLNIVDQSAFRFKAEDYIETMVSNEDEVRSETKSKTNGKSWFQNPFKKK